MFHPILTEDSLQYQHYLFIRRCCIVFTMSHTLSIFPEYHFCKRLEISCKLFNFQVHALYLSHQDVAHRDIIWKTYRSPVDKINIISNELGGQAVPPCSEKQITYHFKVLCVLTSRMCPKACSRGGMLHMGPCYFTDRFSCIHWVICIRGRTCMYMISVNLLRK